MLKLAAADGKTLLEITDAHEPKAVGIDEVQGVVWDFGKGLLKAYGFNGELRRSVPVPSPNDDEDDESDDHKGDDDEEGGHVALAVNPVNGSVWLAIEKDLHHFDSQGQLLESLVLPHHVRGVVLDQSTERLWVATKTSVIAFEDDSTSTNIVVDLGAKPNVRDIDIDPDLEYLWVALKNQLRRYDLTNGALQTSRTVNKLEQVASDRQGGVWLATNRELQRLDAGNKVAVKLKPFKQSEGQIVALAADPLDLTVWVSTEKIVNHIDGQGQVLLTTSFKKPSILDLLLYRDTIAPELQFTSSSEGALVNTAIPVEPLGVCRIDDGGETTLIYAFNNTSSANVELEISDRNTFDDPADRGQPRWFPPGKGAFKTRLNGDSDIWKLGTGEMSGDAATSLCVLESDGGLTKLVLNDNRIAVGIDEGGVAGTAIKDTTQWAAIDRSEREFAAGGTAGSFSVSHDGAALYTIPIRLPRGRGGFVPRELALAYNSNAGNGIVGVGFQLAGASQIQRCTRHATFGDQNIEPIAWDDTTFCLDGKRLIADGPNQYRLEDDPAYRIKITRGAEGTPEVFEVEDGAGNTLVYGESEDSRVEDYILEHVVFDPRKPTQPEVNRSTDKMRFAWSLSTVRNRFGQTATFTYAREFMADEKKKEWGVAQRLTHVAYDGFTVVLNYEARPDAWERYIRGMRLFNNERLGEIRILLGTAEEGTLIRRYVLDYEMAPMTKRSRLTSVTECDGRGACKAPLAFAWQNPDPTFQPTNRHIRLDSDFRTKVTTLAVQVLDLNNDGRDDLFLRTREQVDRNSRKFWEYALSGGQGFGNGDLVPIDPEILPVGDREVSVSNRPVFLGKFDLGFNLGSQKWTLYSELIVTDLNADGNPELGVRTDNGTGPYQFYSWQGGSAFSPFGMTIPRLMPYVGDINGDALPDLVTKNDNPKEWQFHLNSPSRPGLEFPVQLNFRGEGKSGDIHPDLSGALIMDTNGDARYEFLIKRVNASEKRLAGTYAVINPFPFSTGPSISESYLPIQIDWRYVFFDANGDGLPDLIATPPFECGPDNLDFGTGVSPLFFQSSGAGFRTFWRNYEDRPDARQWRFGESVVPAELPPDVAARLCPRFPAVDAIDNGVRAVDLDGDGRQELLVLGERFFCLRQDGRCVRGGMERRQPFVVRLGYDGRWEIDTESLAGLEFSPAVQSLKVVDDGIHIVRNYGYKLTRILDIDGDGIPEILHPRMLGTPSIDNSSIVLEVYKRGSDKADLLASVTDSLGATTAVKYAPMSDRSVFEPATENCSYPLHCPRRGRWLVREVTRSTGVASAPTRRELHRYSGAHVDLSGRDWLGFASHVVKDEARNSETVHEFDNVTRQGRFYPFAGLVHSQRTTYESFFPGRFVRVENINGYRNYSASSDRVLLRPASNCEARYDALLPNPPPPGRARRILPFSEVCTSYTDYDGYGFARNTTRTGSMETLERSTTFEHRADQSPRILGIVTGVREKSAVQGVSQERTMSIVPDGNGLPKTQTIEPSAADAPLTLVTEFVRDDVGLPLEITTTGDSAAPYPDTNKWTPDPQTRKTMTQYDGRGYPRVVINSEGHREEFVYDPGLGVPLARLDANGVLTRFEYDGFGRLISTINPAGADTFVTYSAGPDAPLVVGTTQNEGATILGSTTIHHDILGRPIRRATAAPRSRTVHVWTRYDALGRAVAVSAPQFDPDETKAQFGLVQYDALDRVIERKDPDGIVAATAAYDRLISTVTNARGKKQVVHRDALGAVLVSQTQDEEGNLRGEVTFGYGPFGMLTSASKRLSGTALTTTMTYDLLGRRTSISDPDRGTTQWRYNAFGEAVYEQAADGQVETRFHDRLGRRIDTINEQGLTELSYDGSSGGIGALSRARSPDGIVTTPSYDQFGRPISETVNVLDVGAFTVERSYDAAGRPGGIRYPEVVAGKRFEVSYDYSASAGAVLWRVKDGTGQTLWQAEDHSPFGVLSQEAFGNGLRAVQQIEATTGLLRSIETGFVSDPFYDETSAEPPPGLPNDVERLQAFGFHYDPARNIQLSVEAGQDPGRSPVQVMEEFGYDDLNRLVSWEVTSFPRGQASLAVNYEYRFDDDGNLERRIPDAGDPDWRFEYGGPRPHAIMKSFVGGVSRSYDYDARGRRRMDGERTITYTWFDLPKTIKQGAALIAEFKYDAFGRRVRKHSRGIETLTIAGLYERVSPGPSGTTHRFHIEGPGRVVAEVEWVKRGVDISQEVRYLHVDRQASVEIVTGGKPGQALGRQRFEPYGNMVDPTNLATALVRPLVAGLRRGFTGHEHDEELGFVDMRGRVYDPRSAAFLSPDPVVAQPQMAHSFHPYSYVTHNPANFTDPTGFLRQASSFVLDHPESSGDEAEAADDGSTEADIPGEPMSLAEFDRVIVDGFTVPGNMVIESSVYPAGQTSDDNGSLRQPAPSKNSVVRKRSKAKTGTGTTYLTGEGHAPGCTAGMEGCDEGSAAGRPVLLASNLLDRFTNYATGVADVFSLGTGPALRNLLGLSNAVDMSSPDYAIGRRAGVLADFSMALFSLRPQAMGMGRASVGAGTIARSREAFMSQQLRIILQNPNHALRFLINPGTKTWLARSHLSELPAVQAGHLTSRHSGALERFALEDPFFNQLSNWKGETQGAIFIKSAVNIGGVSVEARTANLWQSLGLLP